MRELVKHSRRTLEQADEAMTAIGDLHIQVGLTQIHLDRMFNWMLEAMIRLAQENTNLLAWEVPSPVPKAQDTYSAVPTLSNLSDPADRVSMEELLKLIKQLWLEMDLVGLVDRAGWMTVLWQFRELKEQLDYYLGPTLLIVPGPAGGNVLAGMAQQGAAGPGFDGTRFTFQFQGLDLGRPASPYGDLEMSRQNMIPSVLELQQAFSAAQGVRPGRQGQQGTDTLG
ncbi:hypothetical protein FRC10_005741 [Ceratobasidium sp. 414]|nr:hypothetical protein FRC10_005741 [Ceratobasidium sp. 414]